jgi:hypothetical protein
MSVIVTPVTALPLASVFPTEIHLAQMLAT